MPCAESLRVQAYFDGELDALAAADIERHLRALRRMPGGARRTSSSCARRCAAN